MALTLPNLLTLGRLMAAPAVALVYLALPRPFADLTALVLFVAAAATDYLDGWLARRRGEVTRLGTMLDPVADKAMVIIALTVVIALSGLSGWVLIPAVAILLREVFVSGLREFLGDTMGALQVSRLAKSKTAVQMVAIALLLLQGGLSEQVLRIAYGLDEATLTAVLSGSEDDVHGLRLADGGAILAWYGGIGALWLAAGLTVVTGWDYFRKALPHLREERGVAER